MGNNSPAGGYADLTDLSNATFLGTTISGSTLRTAWMMHQGGFNYQMVVSVFDVSGVGTLTSSSRVYRATPAYTIADVTGVPTTLTGGK